MADLCIARAAVGSAFPGTASWQPKKGWASLARSTRAEGWDHALRR